MNHLNNTFKLPDLAAVSRGEVSDWSIIYAPRHGMTNKEQFDEIIAPWRVNRKLPLKERFSAATRHAEEILIKSLFVNTSEIKKKLLGGQALKRAELLYLLSRLEQTRNSSLRQIGRPRAPQQRDILIFRVVDWISREFELSYTRGNISPALSAVDAVADALRRIGTSPRGFDRLRKICSAIKKSDYGSEYHEKMLVDCVKKAISTNKVKKVLIVSPDWTPPAGKKG